MHNNKNNYIINFILAIILVIIIYSLLNFKNTQSVESIKYTHQSSKVMCPMHPGYQMKPKCPICSQRPTCPCASREGFEPEINYNDKISFTNYLNNVYKQQFKKE